MTLYMNNDHIISTLNKELDDLEVKIEELSNKYLDLKKENQLLKERQEQEVAEKFKIKEKNQKVQNKVEGIINRLRSLEYTQQ
ncbi:MAG: hypothetical protein ACJ0QX_04090 [Gammaproteobacteria bacterium]